MINHHAKGDTQAISDLTDCQGVYWKLSEFGGLPVFKQQSSDSYETKGLLLWHSDAAHEPGWYISDRMWVNAKGMNEATIFAWLKPESREARLPFFVHVPYNRKKPAPGVVCQSLHTYHMVAIQELKDKLQTAEEGNAWFAGAHESEAAAAAAADESAIVESPVEDDAADVETADSAHGGQKRKTHGGWKPKCAKLINAHYRQKWTLRKHLVNTYYSQDPNMKKIVDSMW